MSEIPDAKFDYTKVAHRQSPFVEYVRGPVVELFRAAQWLKQFHDELSERCDSLSYGLVQNNGDHELALFGGVDANGEYGETALARIYRGFFGLQFRDHDEAVQRYHAGLDVDTEVVVEETAATDFVDEIIGLCEAVIKTAGEIAADWSRKKDPLPKVPPETRDMVGESDYIDTLTDPDTLVERLSSFVEAIQSVLPNYDERAQFIHELDHTPRYYLETVYAGLRDPFALGVEDADELRDHYQTFFGFTEVFVPDVPDDSKEADQFRRHYTISSFEPDSIGDRLMRLYDAIWSAFDSSDDSLSGVRGALAPAFPDLPDYRAEFAERAESALEQTGGWTRPEDIDGFRIADTSEEELDEIQSAFHERRQRDVVTFTPTRATMYAEYSIDGLEIPTCRYDRWGYTKSGTVIDDQRSQEEVPRFGLKPLLDNLAPTLHLLHGVNYRLDIDAETLEVRAL